MPEEREEAVPDEVHGRLVAGHVEEHAGRQELALAQAVPCFLRLDEPAQEIGAGPPTPLLRQAAEVLRHRLGRAAARARSRRGPTGNAMASSARATSRDHSLTVSLSSAGTPRSSRSPSPATDRPALRSRPREAGRPRDRAAGPRWSWTCPRSVSTTRGVNALLTSARRRVWSGGSRNSIDARARTLRPARRSGSRRAPGIRSCRTAGRGGRLGHVVVPGEDVEPERVAVDGVLGPQPVEGRIRILEERGIEEVQRGHARPPSRASVARPPMVGRHGKFTSR